MIKKIYRKVQNFTKLFFLSPSLKAIDTLPNNGEITLGDVGAAGKIEPRWRNYVKNLNYIGFEPDARSRKIISNKITDYKSYKILPYVLSDKVKTSTFNLCKKPQVSSLYKPNFYFLEKFPDAKRFEVIETVDMDCVSLDELNLPKIDFLKLDIQGAENDVLKGANTMLKSVLGLELEVEFIELYKEQPLFGDICKTLSNNEIEFIDFVNLSRWERKAHNGHGQCIFGDALFLRTPEFLLNKKSDIITWSSYIAILLIYRRFDLVEVVLTILPTELKKEFRKFEIFFIKAKGREKIMRYIHTFLNRSVSLFGDCYQLHLNR